ncbi:hypothetical protein MKW98_011778 [Papaver atlanticum]|uniref:Uncharacterized protein n=1 Tax=Papaver atlanticum TaxID=357466 RepID=A0AAD4SNQ3_9MAGN|nr:hypothetical protein MKW98_011778 [Papaver atlanticum]
MDLWVIISQIFEFLFAYRLISVKLDKLSLRICVPCSQQVMLIPLKFNDLMLSAKDASIQPLYSVEGSKQECFLSTQYVVMASELEAIMPSHKSFMIKKKLFLKKMRQNRIIPNWILAGQVTIFSTMQATTWKLFVLNLFRKKRIVSGMS